MHFIKKNLYTNNYNNAVFLLIKIKNKISLMLVITNTIKKILRE
jgi:hypothetical protein